ncbi:RAB6A-GEF complex partner protein 2 [Chrysoperla carnea]|uniref:RAB6A-GEF complex partner protein 2 n=1 Tax=Chrysoperla carnea TaxID=189513 RepID=UPI001D08F42B|nr:RAB6A-GEF complex partner protein 2 [Chrysoperla carnea]
MIEVKAKLIRGSVFLIGETVECYITFSNPPIPNYQTSQSHDDSFESLAWASAQIDCLCTTDGKIGKNPLGATKPKTNSETSLTPCDESGYIEVATKPVILFCDLRLSPGETKSFLYQEVLPNDGPPSYRGQAIKYSYKITIGTQRVNSPIKLLRVPLKILPLSISGLTDAAGLLCNDTTEELTPTNPFLETKPTETPLELALQSLQNITARRQPNFYMISNTRGKVGRFCLFKNAYKLGEDIVGTFDFSIATVSCVQLSVSLQCEEVTTVESKNNKEPSKRSRIITFNKHHEVCLGLKHSQLILPVPLHVTPAFSTPLVTLKWRLHFEFVTSTSKQLIPPGLDQCGWQGPSELPIETMVWSLPVRIFSTTPLQVSLALQAATEHSLIIR